MGKFGQSNQEIWFFKGFINFVYFALSGGILLIFVMSQHYNCLMVLYTNFRKILLFIKNLRYTNFHKIVLFIKIYIVSSFILSYIRAEMNVHAFMNELDQPDYWYSRKIRNGENPCIKSIRELSSCFWYHIFWQSSIQGGRHTQLCIITSLKWIIQICSNFYCWVSKIAFYSPNPHCSPLKEKFRSGREGALASKFNYDFK